MERRHMSMNPLQPDPPDRFPQWSLNETREFIAIRAEFDQTFMETKRNKLLWEVISKRMSEKGFNRNPDQCKCKWKNLVTRFKGTETMEPESSRQFPFQDELRSIFGARMQRLLWQEAEGGGAGTSGKKKVISSDEESNDESESKKKRKVDKGKGSSNISSGGGNNNMQEVLEEFLRQQMQMEAQWFEAFEAREEERRMKEREWREMMETMEKERILMDRRWREREEHRRMIQEARAEKRDQLITALLNKLIREEF